MSIGAGGSKASQVSKEQTTQKTDQQYSGTTSETKSDAAASMLAALAAGFANETKGLRQGLISQLMGILTNPSGKSGFDQSGYDAAMRKYNADMATWKAAQAGGGSPTSGAVPTMIGQKAPAIVPTRTRVLLHNSSGQTLPPSAPLPPSRSDYNQEFDYERALSKYNQDLRAWVTQNQPAAEATTGPIAPPSAPQPAPVAPDRSAFQLGGGVQVPIIAQALEASRRASSQSSQQSADELARTGLVGTPFGQRILAEGTREGNLAAANTQTDIMKALFSMIPSFVLGQSNAAMSGLSGAVGGNTTTSGTTSGNTSGNMFGTSTGSVSGSGKSLKGVF